MKNIRVLNQLKEKEQETGKMRPIYFNGVTFKPPIVKPVTFEQPVAPAVTFDSGERQEESNVISKADDPTSPISFYSKLISFEEGTIEDVEATETCAGGFIVKNRDASHMFEPYIRSVIRQGKKAETMDIVIAKCLGEELQYDKGNKFIPRTANYSLEPQYVEIYILRNGKECSSKRRLAIKISFDNGDTDSFIIKTSEIDSVAQIIATNYMTAILYDPANRMVISNLLREKTHDLQRIRCYEDAGWNYIGSRWVYLTKSTQLENSKVFTELELLVDESIGAMQIGEIFGQALKLYNEPEVGYTLLMYSFQGILYKIFNEAKYPLRYLLYVFGATGSFKTALSKVLFTQLTDEEHRTAPRRMDMDSMASLERGIVKNGVDTVTLIDDFCPPKTSQQKNDMTSRMEMLARMAGDGSSKSRSNAKLEDVRGEGVAGMIVVTGEQLLEEGAHSTALRCVFCEIIGGNVNTEVLSWFQSKNAAFTTLLYHFAKFVSANWERLQKLIETKYELKREAIGRTIKAKRLVDSLVGFWLTAEIVQMFLAEYCDMESIYSLDWLLTVKEAIHSNIVKSVEIAKQEEPSKRFMDALIFVINKGIISLASPDDVLERNVMEYDGFVERGKLYLQMESVLPKIQNHLKNSNQRFGYDQRALLAELKKAEIIDLAANGKGKALCYFRRDFGTGVKEKYIRISLDILKKYQEDEDE